MTMNKKNNIKILSFVLISILPLTASAAFSLSDLSFRGVILQALSVIYTVIPILIGLAFVMFFWGLSRFILNSGSSPEIQKGREYMLWGVIALAVLLSFRGIIAFWTGEFGFGDGTINGVLLHDTSN